jgi:uncharacterized RDD family membrane protein YckC
MKKYINEESLSRFYLRAGAFLIDLVVIYVCVVATLFTFILGYGVWQYGGDQTLIQAMLSRESSTHFARATHLTFYFSYFALAHWYFGRTLGKLAMGIKVAHRGGDLTLGRSIGRSLAYLISGQLTLGIGVLMQIFRKDGRALHDILLDTDVVPATAEVKAEPGQDSRAA